MHRKTTKMIAYIFIHFSIVFSTVFDTKEIACAIQNSLYTIITQKGSPQSECAKNEFDKRKIDYTEVSIDIKDNCCDLILKSLSINSLPALFRKGAYLGGLDEIKKYLQSKECISDIQGSLSNNPSINNCPPPFPLSSILNILQGPIEINKVENVTEDQDCNDECEDNNNECLISENRKSTQGCDSESKQNQQKRLQGVSNQIVGISQIGGKGIPECVNTLNSQPTTYVVPGQNTIPVYTQQNNQAPEKIPAFNQQPLKTQNVFCAPTPLKQNESNDKLVVSIDNTKSRPMKRNKKSRGKGKKKDKKANKKEKRLKANEEIDLNALIKKFPKVSIQLKGNPGSDSSTTDPISSCSSDSSDSCENQKMISAC